MMTLRSLFLVLATTLILPLSAAAQQPEARHPALDTLAQNGYDVTFIGNDFGVDGWLINDNEGRVQYAYETPEGGLITGILFAPDGSLHTAKQVKDFQEVVEQGNQKAMAFNSQVEETGAPISERIYAEVEKSKWFAVGDADAPYIYTFMNPTCAHCIDYWNDHMKALVDDGQIQIRFVPFGQADENREASALLLTAPDAEQRWRAYADGDADAYDVGDVRIPDGMYDAVDVNSGIFSKRKMNGVPFTIYRAPADSQIKVIAGVPENTMMILADFIR